MKKNVGSIDRIVRLVVGAAAVILAIVFKFWWGLLGIILIVTALINWCPIYRIFGLSTAAKEKN